MYKRQDKIKVPKAVFDYEDKNYVTMEALFESAGFTNVKSVPLNDLAAVSYTHLPIRH